MIWTGWGLLLETESGGARIEWRRASQHRFSSYWVLPRPTGINADFQDRRYDLPVPPDARRSFAGIELLSHEYDAGRLYGYRYWSVRVPLVLPLATALTMWLFVLQFRRFRASKMNPFGCPNCGYDLRASSDRCRECGRVIESTDIDGRRSSHDTGAS
jgi:hypothetical protein